MKREKQVMFLLFAVTLLFFVFILFLPKISEYTSEKTGISEAPDTSFFYKSDDLYDLAERYGESGRQTYIFMRWTFDVLWPMVYTAFLTAWIWKLSHYLKIKKIYYVPVIAMMFDYLENIGTTIVFQIYPDKIEIIASITPWMSMLKWTLLGGSFIILIVLFIAAPIKLVRDKLKVRTRRPLGILKKKGAWHQESENYVVNLEPQ